MNTKLITLTTDFGTKDGYVASMKGVILSISPESTIIDITHEIEPQQVLPAAIVLMTSVDYFPSGTVHIAVVDPGVGTDRQLLAVRANEQIFLAPDNGLLGFVIEKYRDHEIRRIENKSLFLPKVSHTFHGRDILSPVGAHLAAGIPFEEVGSITKEFQRSLFPHPVVESDEVRGQIIHRDSFGNLMTNIARDDLKSFRGSEILVRTGYTEIKGLSNAYSDVAKGELLCLFGSADFLEVALREGSAADKLRFPLGTEVVVTSRNE
jgi:S-adenosylmethionine hydrolase